MTDALTDRELDDLFTEHFDDCYETITIGDLKFTASEVVKNCDPVAWDCMMADWVSMMVTDGELVELVSGGYAWDHDVDDGE